VHSNLHRNLDNIGLQQVVFHPLRDKNRTDINVFKFNVKGSEIKYSRLLKNYHRLLFHKKINFLFDDIKNNINLKSVDIQYATTLFSDGALAYKIYKKYKTPYIVALRNTDINLFLKVRPDLYILGKNILMNAQKIIFLSPSLKELFFSNNYFAKFKHQLNHRIKIIPNGIDNYWLGNLCTTNAKSSNKFLFVGRFDRNKNIISLIKSL